MMTQIDDRSSRFQSFVPVAAAKHRRHKTSAIRTSRHCVECRVDETVPSMARDCLMTRVFAPLTQFSEAAKVQRVRVLLRPGNLGSGCENIACSVTVALDGSDSYRIRTTGPHVHAAINRAVERIRRDAPTRVMDRIGARCRPGLEANKKFQKQLSPPPSNLLSNVRGVGSVLWTDIHLLNKKLK